MLIPRAGGRGTIRLGLSGLLGPIGAFPDTPPGDIARELAHQKCLAEDWPGRMVAVAARRGMSPLIRLRRPPGGKVSVHG